MSIIKKVPLFQSVATRAKSLGMDNTMLQTSRDWFRSAATNIKGGISANEIMASSPEKYIKLGYIDVRHFGKMIMFFYDPKTKEELPYYDRFPLVFPFKNADGGFLGLNMHYLSPFQRAKLMNALYQTATKLGSNQQKLKITYQILKSTSSLKAYRPCIKHYLYAHCRSRFMLVNHAEWDFVLMLPVERFESGGGKGGAGKVGAPFSKSKVWSDSIRKIR